MHYIKTISLLTFCAFTINLTVKAQSLPISPNYTANITYYNVEKGLSNNQVNTIYQDNNGITWIATSNGLNRFDGYSFKYFLGKKHGVDLRGISRIGQDDEGWLWLYSHQMLVFMNPQTEEFQTIEQRFDAASPLLDLIKILPETLENFPNDTIGRLYFETEAPYELYTYHSTEGIRKLSIPPSIEILEYELATIKDDNTIVLRERCFNLPYDLQICPKLELSSNDFPNYTLNNKYYTTFNGQYLPIENTAEIETDKAKRPNLQRFNYQDKTAWNIFFDEWAIKVYDPIGKNLINITPQNFPQFSFNNLLNIYFDNQNRAWISTTQGFYIVNILKNNFDFWSSLPVTQDDNIPIDEIIVSADKVTTVFNSHGVRNYFPKTTTWESWNLPNEIGRRAIYKINETEYWMGLGGELKLWTKDSVSATYNLLEKFPLFQDIFISTILPSTANKNILWLGTKYGMFSFDTKSKQFKYIKPTFSDQKYSIQAIVPDDNNQLWLCSPQGLLLFDETEGYLALYNMDQDAEQFLPALNFLHLCKDETEEGVYWLGTAKNGLIRWNKNTGTYRQLTMKDGLPSDIIHTVLSDDFNNIWMSTPLGIIQLNKTALVFKTFGLEEGTGQINFVQASAATYRNKNNRQKLFFGGYGGITSFYPDDFQKNNQLATPQLILLNYQRFEGANKVIKNETTTLINTQKIIIKPTDYVANLEVGLLSYTDMDKNQYSYSIKKRGKKASWQTQSSRHITLRKLPYGKHELRIKAQTIEGIESANELIYTIVVIRPLVLRWWFILSLFFIIAIAIYQWFSFRTREYIERQKELEIIVKNRTEKINEDKKIIEQQAEELRDLDQMKSRFYANVSHELRTPLTLIMAPIENVLTNNQLTNKDYTNLRIAKKNGKRLQKMVNQILDLTKLESKKLALNPVKINWYRFLNSLLAGFESLADMKNINYLFQHEGNEYLNVELDKQKMEIIITNILSNAFKFTPKDGKITVFSKVTEQYLQLKIADTGRGIHKDDLPHVFNRFYQTQHKNAVTEGGTGIGLALTNELISLMNGEIIAESELGIGTSFTIKIPKIQVLGQASTEDVLAIQNEAIEDEAIIIPADTSSSTGRPTLLLVEDNRDLQFFIKSLLEEEYNVIVAGNGQEALEQLGIGNLEIANTDNKTNPLSPYAQRLTPNLIISDIMMPIMDGYQLLEKLKKDSIHKNIPVIMLTARASTDDKLKALRIGVDDYLTKPFIKEELFARIENLLRNAENRQYAIVEQSSEKEVITEKKAKVISAETQQWLNDLEKNILKNIDKINFTIDDLADSMNMSKRQFYRSIKLHIGATPHQYLKTFKLNYARTLLEEGKVDSVKAAAYSVGFPNALYFTKQFKKQFGQVPSAYLG